MGREKQPSEPERTRCFAPVVHPTSAWSSLSFVSLPGLSCKLLRQAAAGHYYPHLPAAFRSGGGEKTEETCEATFALSMEQAERPRGQVRSLAGVKR